MPKIAYVGLSHRRSFTKADLVKAGLSADVEGAAAVSLVRANLPARLNPKGLTNVAEVPQEVADLLLRVEPNDWKLVKDDEEFADPSPDASGNQSVLGDAPNAGTPGGLATDSPETPPAGSARPRART